MKLKLIELRTKDQFSEFIKVENFTTKKECLEIINNYYKDIIPYELNDNNNIEKCELIYLTGDGNIYFYENFSDGIEWLNYDEKYNIEMN
jgi:hypothetical protein